MNALPEITAVREALRPTGEATDVIRELRHEIPPVVEVTVSPHQHIAGIRGGIGRALSDIDWIKTGDDRVDRNLANAVAELRATLRMTESLRAKND